MKTSGMRRALLLAHIFNLLVAIYFIIISIVSLVQLRWYHQLTVTIRIRHVVTSATSYFAFLILIFAALIFIIIFIVNTVNFNPRTYVSPGQDAFDAQQQQQQPTTTTTVSGDQLISSGNNGVETTTTKRRFGAASPMVNDRPLVFIDSTTDRISSNNTKICSSILLHLISSISLIVILVVWLLNTGELVRDSISTQLDSAFAKYQFANRSNHYSVAIDGMQDVNNCCGSLDYTDFPHQRSSGLSSGHYPGSCCGKNMFGVNARVICVPEEIVRAKQTSGCVSVLANHYDLISLLVVPFSLASLFVNVSIIAMMTISKGYAINEDSTRFIMSPRTGRGAPSSHADIELKSAISAST